MSRKGENIYKRKDNRWEARYIKGKSPEGKTLYGYCYAKTYTEAKIRQAEMKHLMSFVSYTPDGKPLTIGYICDEWLMLNVRRFKESTYLRYYTIIENHIKPRLGMLTLERFNNQHLFEFTDELMMEKELSAVTAKNILVLLKNIYQSTLKRFGLPSNVDFIYPRDERKAITVLSVEEQERFVKYLSKNMNNVKFGILFALMTGLRVGEVCAMRCGDVSAKNMTVSVKYTMQRTKNYLGGMYKTRVVCTSPKSECSRRVIPMTDSLLELCKDRLKNKPDAFLLTGSTSDFIEPRVMQYSVKKFGEECGIENMHFHMLRHTFATRCVEVGFEIKSLCEVLGHSSPKVTYERYVNSSIQLKRDNMSKLQAFGF